MLTFLLFICQQRPVEKTTTVGTIRKVSSWSVFLCLLSVCWGQSYLEFVSCNYDAVDELSPLLGARSPPLLPVWDLSDDLGTS